MKKAFTLVEILVVIAILCVLFALLIPFIMAARGGCPDNGITITNKKHTSQWVSTSTTYVNQIPIISTTIHPENWRVEISGWKVLGSGEIECDCWIHISESEFMELDVGDEYEHEKES